MPVRRTKLLPRKTNERDARLFVIATEGQETEKQYFEAFNHRWVKVVPLPAGTDGRSSAKGVLARLDAFSAQYDLGGDDELWLVCDVDHQRAPQLKAICREALQKGYYLGVTNPCFELFLYLHLAEADFDCQGFLDLLAKEEYASKAMEAWLRLRLKDRGGYQKTRLGFERFAPGILQAIERAKALDRKPEERWPSEFGSHLYRLVASLYALLPQETRAAWAAAVDNSDSPSQS